MKGKVCVTGAEGFIGSWLVKRLLETGYTVHATVRDTDETKISHLLSLPAAKERIKLFRTELSEAGSFDAAIADCNGVFHVASPIELASKDPENDMIKPAVEGAVNVLKACRKAKTVKRVVFTSSAAAISFNEPSEQEQDIDESSWSDVNFLRAKNLPGGPYAISKTLAEQVAWEYVNEHGMDMVTIIPVLVTGPFITPMVPHSVQVAISPLTGNPECFQFLKGLQIVSGSLYLVHVEDVCNAQIFLMENPGTQGRHICAPINTSLPQLVEYLVERYPQYNVLTEIDDVPRTSKLNITSKKLVESGFTFQHGMDEIYNHTLECLKDKGWVA